MMHPKCRFHGSLSKAAGYEAAVPRVLVDATHLGGATAQPLRDGPDMQFNDAAPERALKVDRARRASRHLCASPGAGLVEQLLQHLIGLRADHPIPRGDKGRDAGHAPLPRLRPVGVDGVLEAALG